MQEKIKAYFKEHEREMIEDLRSLVKIPSVVSDPKNGKPYGEASAAAMDQAMALCKKNGFPVTNFDYYAFHADLGENPALGLLAHADVVSEGNGWTYPCYDCTEEDGKIYGRGTSDDKGPLISCLYAMKCIQDLNIPLKRGVRLIVGGAEELGDHKDIAYYHERQEMPPSIITVDSDYPLINAEKGIIRAMAEKKGMQPQTGQRYVSFMSGSDVINAVPGEAFALVHGVSLDTLKEKEKQLHLDVTFTFESKENGSFQIKALGKRCHGSTPERGINALTGLLTLLDQLDLQGEMADIIHRCCEYFPHGDYNGKTAGLYYHKDPMGDVTANVSMMDYDQKDLSVGIEVRYPNGSTAKEMIGKIQEITKKIGLTSFDLSMSTEPHYIDPSNPLVETLLDVWHDHTGQKKECLSSGGGTYVHGLPGVAFGPYFPGVDYRIHGRDEYTIIDEFLLTTEMITDVIMRICG